MHEPTPPTLDKHGDETHPAFGSITAHRVTSTPGAVLFDSDVRHEQFVRVSIGGMTRKRDLRSDWLHATNPVVEVDMSEAQWASFVSSMNTSAVPCTIRRASGDWNVPGLEFEPRLALSMAEAKGAAAEAFRGIQQAQAAVDALDKKAPAAVKRAAEADLRRAIAHASSGVDFASKMLVEHAENVVQKARADVEAMVLAKARDLGLTAEQAEALMPGAHPQAPAITADPQP